MDQSSTRHDGKCGSLLHLYIGLLLLFFLLLLVHLEGLPGFTCLGESSNLWHFLDQTWAVFDVRPPITHPPLSVCTTHVQARVADVCLCFLSFSVCYFKVENEEELLLQNLYISYLFYLSLEPEGGVLGNRRSIPLAGLDHSCICMVNMKLM